MSAEAREADDASKDKSFSISVDTLKNVGRYLLTLGAAHVTIDRLLPLFIDNKTLATARSGDRLYLAERIVGAVYGGVVGLAGIDLIFVKKAFEKDCFGPYPETADKMLSASLAFSIYDIGVMLLHGGEPLSMWFHHVVQAYGCFLMLGFKHATFFPLVFFITELTIVPNNLLWIVQKFASSQHSLIRWLLLARAAFFLLFRTFIAPFSIYYGISRGNFIKNIKKTHPIIVAGSTFNIGALGVLNIIWTLTMLKNLRRPLNAKTVEALAHRH